MVFFYYFSFTQIPRIFYWLTLRQYQIKLPAIIPKIYKDGISAVYASQDIISRKRMEQLYKDLRRGAFRFHIR